MTAAEFAALVDSRRKGKEQWMGRCPAHRDRSPSMSIAAGRDGRVLVYCFAGCSVDSILSALKLTRRDLFNGPPPSPAQLAALEAERKATEQERRARRTAEREAWDKVRRWKAIVSALGAKLARTPDNAPDGDALTRTFHTACDRLHEAEVAALAASGIREAA